MTTRPAPLLQPPCARRPPPARPALRCLGLVLATALAAGAASSCGHTSPPSGNAGPLAAPPTAAAAPPATAAVEKPSLTPNSPTSAPSAVSAVSAVSNPPETISGRFHVAVKGDLQLYLNGRPVPLAGGLSPEVSLAPGSILAVRINSAFVYRAVRLAFVSADGRWTNPFLRSHFRLVEGEPAAITAAMVERATEEPVVARPDPKTQQAWTDMNLHADEAQWMWGPKSKQSYQYACVVNRRMYRAVEPGQGPPVAVAGLATAKAAETSPSAGDAAQAASQPAAQAQPAVQPDATTSRAKSTKHKSARRDKGEPAGKREAPSEAAQAEAAPRVERAYKLAAARTPAEKVALAGSILEQCHKGRHYNGGPGDTTDRYVLLHKAAELAADGGDGLLAFQAVDALADNCGIDRQIMKYQMLDRLTTAGTEPARMKSLLKCVQETDHETFGRGDEPQIEHLRCRLRAVEQFKALCQQPQAQAIRDEARKWLAKAEPGITYWRPLLDYEETLRKNPDDPEANFEVGTWYFFFAGNAATRLRQRACAYLAKCSDPALAAAAKADLTCPADPEEQVRVGDLWAATDRPRSQRLISALAYGASYDRRAYFWYQRALPGLSGPTQARVEALLHPDRDPKPGLVAYVRVQTPQKLLGTHLFGIVESSDDFTWLGRKALEELKPLGLTGTPDFRLFGQVYLKKPGKVLFQLHNAHCVLEGHAVPDASEDPGNFQRLVGDATGHMAIIELRRENPAIPEWSFRVVSAEDGKSVLHYRIPYYKEFVDLEHKVGGQMLHGKRVVRDGGAQPAP